MRQNQKPGNIYLRSASKILAEAVTDVLVVSAEDQQVVLSTAKNAGA